VEKARKQAELIQKNKERDARVSQKKLEQKKAAEERARLRKEKAEKVRARKKLHDAAILAKKKEEEAQQLELEETARKQAAKAAEKQQRQHEADLKQEADLKKQKVIKLKIAKAAQKKVIEIQKIKDVQKKKELAEAAAAKAVQNLKMVAKTIAKSEEKAEETEPKKFAKKVKFIFPQMINLLSKTKKKSPAATVQSTAPSTQSTTGFTYGVASSIQPAIAVPIPNAARIRFLKSILPSVYQADLYRPLQISRMHQRQIREIFPTLKSPHTSRENIGEYIDVIVSPNGHRFEFIVYPAVGKIAINKMIHRIMMHLKSVSKRVNINLFEQRDKHKHVKILSKEKLFSKSVQKHLQKIFRKRNRKTKHYVLHQTNATGGCLFSKTIYNI
jgi:hypothetical protein